MTILSYIAKVFASLINFKVLRWKGNLSNSESSVVIIGALKEEDRKVSVREGDMMSEQRSKREGALTMRQLLALEVEEEAIS